MIEDEIRQTTQEKPFANEVGATVGFYEIKPEPLQQKEKPSTLETFKAQVLHDNVIYNNVLKIDNEFRTLFEYQEQDTDFNPLDRKLLELAEPDDWPELVTSKTRGEFFRRLTRRNIERENRQKAIDGTLGGNIMGTVLNGVTDPTMWIPIANGLRTAKLTTSFASGFAKALPGTFAAASISEANLLWAKETNTIQEAALNTVTMTLMGGIVGGGIGAYRTLNATAYKNLIQDTVQGKEVKFSLDAKGEVDGFKIFDDSAGAQSVKQIWLRDNQIYGFASDGKLTLAKPFFWMAGKWFKNPVVQGYMSKSPTIAKFTADMYEHNFDIVKSVVYDKFKPQSLQTLLRKYETQTAKADLEVVNSYFDYLGLPKDSSLSALRSFGKDRNKLKFADYTLELNLAITRGGVHQDSKIASAATNIYNGFYKPLEEDLVQLGLLAPNIKPFGAVQYLNRIPDRAYIVANRRKVSDFLQGEFAKTNDKITKALSKVTNLENTLQAEKTLLIDAVGAEKIALEARIKSLEKQLSKEKKRVRNKLRQAKYSPDMLVGKAGMNFEEVKQLKTLRKPINLAKKELKRLEQELSVHKRKINEGRKPGQKNKPADEAQLALEAQIKLQKEELEKLRLHIEDAVEKGTIPEKFVRTSSQGRKYLKKPDYGTLQLRKILNETELREAAENTIDNMIGLNDFEITEGIMDGITNGSAGTNPLMPRTLLIDDELLYKNKILVSDTRQNIKAYIGRLGRIVEMQKYLKANGYHGEKTPVQWLTHNIREDYKALERQLTRKFEKQREGVLDQNTLNRIDLKEQNARTKLDKDLNRDINLASVAYNRITGGYDFNPKQAGLIRTSRLLNNWAYATQLGALLFVSLQEAVAPIYRIGLTHISDGVLPFFGNLLKGDWKANKLLREQAADLAMGIELNRAMYDIAFQTGKDFELPMSWLERQAGNAASAMGIANFSNIWSDMCLSATATSSISKNIRRLQKFVDGTISKSEKQQLAVLGLNNEIIAKKILKEFDKHGERLSRAKLANWNLWSDREAKDAFQAAIMQEVRSVNFSGKNIANYPSTFENPNGLSASFLIYMGWMFNATANYTLPLLQRFDANKIMGASMMIAAGMLVDPLRKISRGEDPNLEPFELFKKGFLNSGVGGIMVDLFNKANSIGGIIPALQVDRYKGKGFELAAGMPGTLIDVGLNFAGQAANNEWNKSDLKKLKRTIPLLEAFYLRKITNDWIDDLDIPKTRNQARKANEE